MLFGSSLRNPSLPWVLRLLLHLRYFFDIIFFLPEVQLSVISLGQSVGNSQLDLSETVIFPWQFLALSTPMMVFLLRSASSHVILLCSGLHCCCREPAGGCTAAPLLDSAFAVWPLSEPSLFSLVFCSLRAWLWGGCVANNAIGDPRDCSPLYRSAGVCSFRLHFP